MKERYKIVYQGGEGEIVEKKSRFIAEIRPVESEEEATAFIAEVRRNIGMRDIIVRHLRSEKITRWRAAATTANRRRRRDARCWMCCWDVSFTMSVRS